jgi:hypothetical protein
MAARKKPFQLIADYENSEAEFQRQVIQYAQFCGWLCYSIPDSRRSTLAGWPDVVFMRDTRIVFSEMKREKGKTSPAQDVVLATLSAIAEANKTMEVYVWRPSDWPEIEVILKWKPTKNRVKKTD